VDNIRVASELIHSFKQVAVDQSSERKRHFNLKTTIEEVLATLSPTLKKTPHKIHLEIEANIMVHSYPGPLGQVITNLVNNSLIHGFEKDQPGNIHLQAYYQNHSVHLTYTDDGKGIPETVQNRVFEPFFTTRMGQGGSGLGMHIVHNIVTGILRGKLKLISAPGQGVEIRIEFPISIDPVTNIEDIV
jgi:signal transduction histidine kinase